MTQTVTLKKNCRRCPRLVALRKQVRRNYPDYYAAPVLSFGAKNAELIVVGLAPGMHGANASGRPFTGDQSGEMLYKALYHHGLASQPQSQSVGDSLQLYNCRVTNAVKCLPPQNKPIGSEITNCNDFLAGELVEAKLVIALGGIAHRAIIKAKGLKQTDYPFAHAGEYQLGNGCMLIDSYHCSRYNTQTKRLTPAMFNDVFVRANELLVSV